ncbi:prephenate dehydrogenase [Dermatophilaceae bacterium Soc4.6]
MTPRVRVVGTGLIGTSLGIALSRKGFEVTLSDPSPTAMRLARDLGAGVLADEAGQPPQLVVVAAPPDVAGSVVAHALRRWTDAVVTDVSSVKGAVVRAVRQQGGDLSRYVGSHPMAGRERSGAMAARADLFEGRAWVVVPTPESSPYAVELTREVARAVGSVVTVMDADEHDAAVAVVSHVPQVVASLVAGRLRDLSDDAVALAGQGLRDVTRIAASDPGLWTQILAGNAEAVREVLHQVRTDLDAVIAALSGLVEQGQPEQGHDSAGGDAPGALAAVSRAISDGNTGHARIPGKHGGGPTAYATVVVVVPDTPGALADLLSDVGAAGVNLEDLRLDHGLGLPFGLAEVFVLPTAVEHLQTALAARGWRVHD